MPWYYWIGIAALDVVIDCVFLFVLAALWASRAGGSR